jgi:dihydrofolate synthase / folylpolyglutamate synthase
MTMRYSDACALLENLQSGAIHPGLATTRKLMRTCGHPERRFRAIHLAGTNGKGSTAAMLDAMLRSAGYRTGLYTSPHIHSFTERIRVNGRNIPRKTVAKFVTDNRQLFRDTGCTYFEAATLLAFQYFAQQAIDIAVVETGLGGRWDATSVIRPDCTLITTIGLDHVQILGRSYRQIAMEKAGILKPDVPAILGRVPAPAAAAIWKVAEERDVPLRSLPAETHVQQLHLDWEHSIFSYRDAWGNLPDVRIPLIGRHQIDNAAMALYCLRWMRAQGLDISDRTMQHGLAALSWPGRLELINKQPLTLVDVTHNPAGAAATLRTLQTLRTNPRIRLVLGMAHNKDLRGYLRVMQPAVTQIYAVTLTQMPAWHARDIVAEAKQFGIPASSCTTVDTAQQAAARQCKPDEILLISGSHLTAQCISTERKA